jgi:hypothetical protein
MQITVERVKNDVKQLSREDLREVQEFLDTLLKTEETKPKMSEEEFEKYLAEEGFITEYKPPVKDFSSYENYQPVTVTGEPISEMLIRERR